MDLTCRVTAPPRAVRQDPRLAQLEASYYFTKHAYEDLKVYDTHVVIRDLAGKPVHEYQNLDNGTKITATFRLVPE